MRRLSLLAVAAAALLLAGCGAGPPVSQTRSVGTFERLEVDGSLNLDVALFNRPDPGIRITAGENSIDRIRTEVRDGTLHISTDSEGLVIGPNPLGDVSVSLGVPALAEVVVDGSSSVAVSGLSARTLSLRVRGSGDLQARGRVDRLSVEIDGSGDTNLAELAARDANVRIDGSGDMDLRVSQSLELVLEGSGNVTYRGRPRVSSRIEGSGDVTQRDR